MRKAILFMGLIGWFFSGKSQEKATKPDDLSSFIQQKGDSLLKANKLPGIFVGVLNKGERHYYNFGYAIPDEKKPFNAATVFEAGSITKTFTAYIVESILQEKRIPDTTSIITYLPDSVQRNTSLQNITFRSLLNHTAGFPRLPENMRLEETDMDPYRHYTEQDLFAYLKTARPNPDGKSNYSNLGMGLAGVLAQRMTGKKYADLLNEYVFILFAMKASDGTDNRLKSQGYFDTQKAHYWNMNVLAPAGGIQSTGDEMLSYLQYMSTPRTPTSKTIIEQLLAPTASLSPAVRIGKGWLTFEQKGKPIIYWHNGGTYGFSTFAAFVKDTEQAVVVVVNQASKSQISDGLGISIMRKMLE